MFSTRLLTSGCLESQRSPERARRSSYPNSIGYSSLCGQAVAIRQRYGCFVLSLDVRSHARRYGAAIVTSAAFIASGAAVGLLLGWTSQAHAYRPFDGTDAAVADPGEVEVELQPAAAQWSREQNLLIAPAVVYNYGLTENWEAVLESQLQTPFSPSGPTTLSASGAFLKHIIRPGALQDKAGPSIATEFGVLLPDSNGDSRFGASIDTIVSQRWEWGTAHLNIAAELTRDQRGAVFTDLILEGPSKGV